MYLTIEKLPSFVEVTIERQTAAVPYHTQFVLVLTGNAKTDSFNHIATLQLVKVSLLTPRT